MSILKSTLLGLWLFGFATMVFYTLPYTLPSTTICLLTPLSPRV